MVKTGATCLIITSLLTSCCLAEIIIVDDDGTTGYDNIQVAVDYSTSGDVIVVFPGSYSGSGNRSIDFGGKAVTVQSINPDDPNVVTATIIDCENINRAFNFHNGEDSNSGVWGLTIINGKADNGGAIYCSQSSPLIKKCIIKNCTATTKGGGIYCDFGADAAIENCLIAENTASYGGGVCCHYGSPEIISCNITGNYAQWAGGGISSRFNKPVISQCVISENKASGGGGIELKDSQAEISFCRVLNNQGFNGYGGGITARNNITIDNCIIAGNNASWVGGGIYCEEDIALLRNCTIIRNSANSTGGAVYCKANSQSIVNCTIGDNTASQCGGVYCKDSSLIVLNSIIWGHNDPVSSEGYSTIGVNYSDIQNGWEGQGNICSDPCFVNSSGLDYHLSAKSLCINAGQPEANSDCGIFDVDSQIRITMGQIDIGSDEFVARGSFIKVEPFEVKFYCYDNFLTSGTQKIQLQNLGNGVVNWTTRENCTWLQVNPVSGDFSDCSEQIELSVDCNLMEAGKYSATLSIIDSNADNNPVILNVKLNVGAVHRVPADYMTIQRAIDAASDYDLVLVSPGTYTGQGNMDVVLNGKNIWLCSEQGAESCIIDCRKTGRAFYFNQGLTEETILDGFTITNGMATRGGAILCEDASVSIRNCTITNNKALYEGGGVCCWPNSNPEIENCMVSFNHAAIGGGIFALGGSGKIQNCIIAKNSSLNDGGGLFWCNGLIANCTIYGNTAGSNGSGLCKCSGQIVNCIVWNNNTPDPTSQIYKCGQITYSCLEELSSGLGNIFADPCFVDPEKGNYHLKSQGWRWDLTRKVWTWDETTSRCIDAGNPGWLIGSEQTSITNDPTNQWGENLRINMGNYGGTLEASMPPYHWALISDLNNDGIVNLQDMSLLAAIFDSSADNNFADLNHDKKNDFEDFRLLFADWLSNAIWH